MRRKSKGPKHDPLCPRRQDPGPLGQPDPCQCRLIKKVVRREAARHHDGGDCECVSAYTVEEFKTAIRSVLEEEAPTP